MSPSQTHAEIGIASQPEVWRKVVALDYHHDPLSISQTGRAVWAFGEMPSDLIRAQRVAIATAKKRGMNPDGPRGLTRSINLKH